MFVAIPNIMGEWRSLQRHERPAVHRASARPIRYVVMPIITDINEHQKESQI